MAYQNSTHTHSNVIGLRLKSEMKNNGISAAELARRSGVLTSFIYDVISGKSTNPSILKLAKVADCLGINLPYLVHGELSTTSTTNQTDEEKYISIPHIKLGNTKNTHKRIVSFVKDAEQYRFGVKWLRDRFGSNTDSLRMFTISGDSMEPTICHNDVVMIDTNQKSPSPPSIFILFDGFGLSAKRLEYVVKSQNKLLRVISDNKHYSTYERSAEEVTVVGRLVWFSREI